MGSESIEPEAATHRGTEPRPADLVVTLPADVAAPALARRHLSVHAEGVPKALINDALLLVSELVGNAVQHGQPDIILRIRRAPPGIGVSVQDRGSEQPVLPTEAPDMNAKSGRGLRIVDALSSSWGVEPADPPPGKIVWFELGEPPVASA
jgi:anti-sigma regulatory factor (Ser/Thr protein kinase)